MDVERIRQDFPVLYTRVPGARGLTFPLRFFDHAASTHAPEPVIAAVVDLLRNGYANVHRGAHHLSERATDSFEDARETVKSFVGAPATHEVVFTMNTTQALNLASHVASSQRRASRDRSHGGGALHDGPVLTTKIEHHSNLLPHQAHGKVELVHITKDGRIDLDELETRLRRDPAPRLLALSCASNVTGVKTPLREVLEHAQDAGVPTLLDGAQILAHERLDLARLPGGGPDYFAGAGHKAYAPMGSAFLVAKRELLDQAPPWMPGGGTVRLVMESEVIWAESPDRHEGGTPNVAGAVALAAALRYLERADREACERREGVLFERLLEGLASIPRVRMLGPQSAKDRVAVVSFMIEGWSPACLATALNFEAGAAVRHGCFCAHPYFFDLMGMQAGPFVEKLRAGASTSGPGVPGAVRASLGIYNTREDVDALVSAVRHVAARPPDSGYRWVEEKEHWVPAPIG